MKVYVIEHKGIPIDVHLFKQSAHEAVYYMVVDDLSRAKDYAVVAYKAKPINVS